jgi:hypothetical protein
MLPLNPDSLTRYLLMSRTTNVIERCFVEVRRRILPTVCFVNMESVDRIRQPHPRQSERCSGCERPCDFPSVWSPFQESFWWDDLMAGSSKLHQA